MRLFTAFKKLEVNFISYSVIKIKDVPVAGPGSPR